MARDSVLGEFDMRNPGIFSRLFEKAANGFVRMVGEMQQVFFFPEIRKKFPAVFQRCVGERGEGQVFVLLQAKIRKPEEIEVVVVLR